MTLIIKNIKTLAKYIPGSSQDSLVDCEILIRDGKINQLGPAGTIKSDSDTTQLDGHGLFLAPGFIDPQVHFREPGGEKKEDLKSGSLSAVRGGFTTVIAMANTNPTIDTPELILSTYQKSSELGLTRILPTSSVTKSLKGKVLTDFEALKKAGAVALTDDGKGIQDDQVMEQAMVLAKKVGLPILDHAEDESISKQGAIHEGEIAKKYNIPGIKSESEAVHVKRGCELSAKTGCHYHVLHISAKASLDYVKQAKKNGLPVTCEVSPHHLLLCDLEIPVVEGKVDTNFKMNPPLRSKEDREAAVEALLDGTIDAIATDHAPHTEEEKARDIQKAPFGIVGLETSFPLMYTHFVKSGKLTLERLVHLMTSGPAKIFNLPFGTLGIGQSADLTLIDLDSPRKINKDQFESKGKNTPFNNWEVYGIPRLTIFEGNIVFNEL